MIILKHSFLTDIKLFFITLAQKRWLDKNGYYYHLSVLKKYKKANYANIISKANTELEKYDFVKNLKKDYIVFLSNYGALGSFNNPNIVYANSQRTPKEISLTIMHEIIHLLLEEDVQFKKLSHEKKEKLVEKKFNELIQV